MYKKSVIIGLAPQRNNITYHVQPKPDIAVLINELVEEIKLKQNTFPKTVLFCRRYNDCSLFYLSLRKRLEYFKYVTSFIETHWIQSCNWKDKIMNKEARTIPNMY